MVHAIKNGWICPICQHEYQGVSLGEVCPRDGAVLLRQDVFDQHGADKLLGACVDQRYHLIDVLGRGGFGTVYRCYDTVSAGEFALKTITDKGIETNTEVRQRFLQEGRALSQLVSEHVVKVFDTGETNGTLYMVLELIRGLSLKQHLYHEGTLKLINAARIVTQILSALEHAHAAGLIHRDLKPSNILFTDLNATHLKLIDFGIAKSIHPAEDLDPVTKTGLVIGTVQYMAPEQLRQNLPIGPASDLYATGILFYQFLTGDTPFVGSQAEVAAGHLYQYPPKLSPDLGVPPAVSEWLQIVLSKEPADRFPNAMTMRIELAKAMGTPEENLNTTLPLANDTIRMTPDISFMQVMTGSAPSEEELAFVASSETGLLGSRDNDSEHGQLNPANDKVTETPSLSALVQNQSHREAADKTAPSQASTQKLTALQLLVASSRSKASQPKGASTLQIEEPADEKDNDINNRTDLADIPAMLFADETRTRTERPEAASSPPSVTPESAHQGSYEPADGQALPARLKSGPVQDHAVLKTGLLVSHPPPVNHEVNHQSAADPITSFALPSASGWWVLPFIMVLSVIAYFIWL